MLASGYLDASSEAIHRVGVECLNDVTDAAALLADALRGGGKLLICGNGGSAADAQHLATEFVSTLTVANRRPAIPAIALTTDTSLLTAIANDFGFEEVFERQVEALGSEGDVLIAISTGGDSSNVVRASERARAQHLKVVTLTGESGGRLAPLADVAIRVPSPATGHVQECHLAVEHLLALLVEQELYPAGAPESWPS
ncbi:MAG: SIS domain-containing protein [Actinobacteria bacterium]|nr:SIS domain-containing protein [Actinomycetota bacterium]